MTSSCSFITTGPDRQAANFAEVRNTFDVDFLQRLRLAGRQEISWGLGVRVRPRGQ